MTPAIVGTFLTGRPGGGGGGGGGSGGQIKNEMEGEGRGSWMIQPGDHRTGSQRYVAPGTLQAHGKGPARSCPHRGCVDYVSPECWMSYVRKPRALAMMYALVLCCQLHFFPSAL